MWQAIRNAARLVKPGGIFFIAIYNRVGGPFGSHSWLRLKRIYNNSSRVVKTLIEYSFISLIVLKMLLTFKNPVSEIKITKRIEVMSFRTDIKILSEVILMNLQMLEKCLGSANKSSGLYWKI